MPAARCRSIFVAQPGSARGVASGKQGKDRLEDSDSLAAGTAPRDLVRLAAGLRGRPSLMCSNRFLEPLRSEPSRQLMLASIIPSFLTSRNDRSAAMRATERRRTVRRGGISAPQVASAPPWAAGNWFTTETERATKRTRPKQRPKNPN